jgi:hypothetical protein
MLTLMGVPDAEARAARIFELETKIARAHVDAVDAQDPHRVQTWARSDFASRAPGIDWDAFFEAARLGGETGSSRGTPNRSAASRPSSPASRSTSGRTGSPSHRQPHDRGAAAGL